MSLNKPKYTLLENTSYALSGLKDIFLNEYSFKLQLILIVVLSCILFFLSLPLNYKIVLLFSLLLPILAEIVNSAIERTVDLVTLEYHDLAKKAKDVGAALVLISFMITTCVWVVVIYLHDI